MIARLVLPLLGLLLLGVGAWVIAEYPIEVSWFTYGIGGNAPPDLTPAISTLTVVGLALLVLGGSLVGAAVGYSLGRRRARRTVSASDLEATAA